MGLRRFFRELAMLLTFLLLAVGLLLLTDAKTDKGAAQSWALLAGALLCSLSLFILYFLFKPTQHG